MGGPKGWGPKKKVANIEIYVIFEVFAFCGGRTKADFKDWDTGFVSDSTYKFTSGSSRAMLSQCVSEDLLYLQLLCTLLAWQRVHQNLIPVIDNLLPSQHEISLPQCLWQSLQPSGRTAGCDLHLLEEASRPQSSLPVVPCPGVLI